MITTKVTIGEIARQAEVSKGTVSRVINGKSTVASATREKVLGVMKRLGYEPDPVARELSRRTKHVLGIWVGQGENRLSPYFNLIWRALLHEIQVRATQFIELPIDIVPVRRHLDAVLVFACADLENRLALLRSRGIPAVMVGHWPGVSGVAPDDIGGGREAARQLLARGHRRLLHLSVAAQQWAEDRAQGFQEAAAAGGGEAPVVVTGEASVLSGYRLMRETWLQGHRPSAIFCATDEMAVGALGALADLGVKVPEQVSLVGFDGLVDLSPGLATVSQDIPAIAHAAVALALAAIESDEPRQITVPVQFLPGATLGEAPSGKPRRRA